MSRLRVLLPLSLCLLLIASAAGPSPAQDRVDISEFNSGDIDFRTYSYLQLAKPLALPFVFFPGDGIRAVYFRDKPDGSPGWTRRIEERGFNALAMEHVGSAMAITPPDDDILKLMEKGLFGVYQVGMATRPEFAVGHEMAAGLLLKARSQDEAVGRALILIDPIGPQRSQPMTTLTPRDLLEQRKELGDHLWRKWGFGPREGKLRRGLDLSMAAAESVLSTYDAKMPAYWAGLLTDMHSGLEVREPIKLFDLPVLVVRTPAADKEQIAREEAVVAWMLERGVRVDRLDLAQDPVLKKVSGLPWMGDLSDQVLDRFFEWHAGLDLPERTDGIGL